jgi:hypothetical protein
MLLFLCSLELSQKTFVDLHRSTCLVMATLIELLFQKI